MGNIRNIIKKLCAIAIVTPALMTAAYGLTLNECIEEVLNTNPRVLEKLKYYNSVVHSKDAVRSRKNPTVYLDSSLGKQNVKNSSTRYKTSINDVSGARVTARQLLSDGSRLNHDIRALEAHSRSALFSYVDTANVLAYETAESYINILKYRELMALAIENVEIHTRLMNNIKARVEAETAGKSELERVQGRLAMAQSTYIVRQNDYKRAIYQFHKLLGRFVDGSDFVMPFISGELIPNSLKDSIQRQWECNPNLIASDYNIVSREFEYKRERAENRPDFYLEGIKDWNKNRSGLRGEDNETSIWLRVSVPIFDGNYAHHKKQQYRSLVHNEKHRRDNVARTLLNDLNLIYTGYKQLETQIYAMRKSLFFTKRALRSYQQEFKLGKRQLINILDAEVEYQNARSQLATLRADLLISKFRLLYSMGTIVEDLGLYIPLAEELAEAKRTRPATKDDLPLFLDFDSDTVEDRFDVSINSLREQLVNEIGETERMTAMYLTEPIRFTQLSEELKVIKNKADLQLQAIRPDIPTEIGFITFVSGTSELSDRAKVLMREVLPQLKRLADDGNIKITVTQGDSSADIDSKLLALRRAYNLKKILTMHLFDPDAIVVEAREAKGTESKDAMVLTVQSDIKSFTDHLSSMIEYSMVFEGQSDKISDNMTVRLRELADRFNKAQEPTVDVIAYSNDMNNPSLDKDLSLKRAENICREMVRLGLTKKVNPIGWGTYDADFDFYSPIEKPLGLNIVEFVLRD